MSLALGMHDGARTRPGVWSRGRGRGFPRGCGGVGSCAGLPAAPSPRAGVPHEGLPEAFKVNPKVKVKS